MYYILLYILFGLNINFTNAKPIMIEYIIAKIDNKIILQNEVNQFLFFHLLFKKNIHNSFNKSYQKQILQYFIKKYLIDNQCKNLKIFINLQQLTNSIQKIKNKINISTKQLKHILLSQGYHSLKFKHYLKNKLIQIKLIKKFILPKIYIDHYNTIYNNTYKHVKLYHIFIKLNKKYKQEKTLLKIIKYANKKPTVMIPNNILYIKYYHIHKTIHKHITNNLSKFIFNSNQNHTIKPSKIRNNIHCFLTHPNIINKCLLKKQIKLKLFKQKILILLNAYIKTVNDNTFIRIYNVNNIK